MIMDPGNNTAETTFGVSPIQESNQVQLDCFSVLSVMKSLIF